MRRFLVCSILLLWIFPATAQIVISASSVDPYILNESIAPGLNQTAGLTARSLTINTGVKNLVLIVDGQSNMANVCPTVFVPVNNTVIDNFNIYDGAAYPITAGIGLQGATNALPTGSLGVGNVAARLADLFITNGNFARVILVPIAVGGTTVAQHATGQLSAPGIGGRVGVAMRRLAARGITPAITNVTFGIIWGQGETDNAIATSGASYQSSFTTYVANNVSAGFSGRTFINVETISANAASATIAGAQAALINGTTIFAGGNLDTLTGGTNRQADGTHFTDTGAASAATLMYNAMHASGAPY